MCIRDRTGTQEFMGFEFLVNEHVLIPRQDTETLVELVLQEQKGKDAALLDVCTGSGCIAISLALMGGFRDVTALDVSREALMVAARNAQRLLKEDVYKRQRLRPAAVRFPAVLTRLPFTCPSGFSALPATCVKAEA